jgi:hypothetical protein
MAGMREQRKAYKLLVGKPERTPKNMMNISQRCNLLADNLCYLFPKTA